MDLSAIPYILLTGLLFGSTLVVSRFSVGQFDPTTYIGLRFVLASLGYGVIYALGIKGRQWPKDKLLWKRGAILGIFGSAIPMTAIVVSLQYQSSGITSLLITTSPAMTALLAHFTLDDERLNLRKSMGVLLALSGTVLMAVRGESGLPGVEHASPIGYGLVILAMISGSIMTIYARKYMRNFDTFEVSSVRIFTAAVVVMPLSLIFVGFDLSQVNQSGYMALIYAALVGTFFGFLLQFFNIQRFGATAAVMVAYIIPVVASFIGVLFLGEVFTVGMLWGMALIISGVYLINRGSAMKRVHLPS